MIIGEKSGINPLAVPRFIKDGSHGRFGQVKQRGSAGQQQPASGCLRVYPRIETEDPEVSD